MPDIDPNDLQRKGRRIAQFDRIVDLLLDNFERLLTGKSIKLTRTSEDNEGNEVIEIIYQEVTAADRAALIRLMASNGVSLDVATLPVSLVAAMRREMSDPTADLDEEDVA